MELRKQRVELHGPHQRVHSQPLCGKEVECLKPPGRQRTDGRERSVVNRRVVAERDHAPQPGGLRRISKGPATREMSGVQWYLAHKKLLPPTVGP